MSRGRWALAVLLLVGSAQVAQSDPIPYTVVFAEEAGGALLPTSGSFTYDPASGVFTDFLVVWNGATFDLTAAANSPVLGGMAAGGVSLGTGAATFAMLSGLPAQPCGGWDSSWASSWNEMSQTGQFGFFAWAPEGCEQETIGFHSTLGAYGSTMGGVDHASGTWSIYQVMVPDPGSTLLLLSAGLVGLCAYRTRRPSTRVP